MTLPAGSRLGSYEILSGIGAGGMGEVYRARDTKLGRDVAIKVLPEAFILDPDRLARFKREAHVLAALNHPNIAGIYGFEESDGIQALALELVEGVTLADRIAQGPMPIGEALPIARQIAEALDAAHEKGIIHRDLKPANIKLRADGVVKVLDFGLAKMFSREGAIADELPTITAGGTRDGMILGTAAYMSPEQARGRSVDKRTDIWAFGCVVYELLAGRLAFAGATPSDTIAAILEHEPDWRALPGATPRHIRQLLRRCLEKDPKRRLRDIGDAAIEPAPDQSADSLVELNPVAPLRKWIWVAASLAVIGAVGAAIWLWPRPEAPRASALVASPITTYPGREVYPSFSPDGTQVAFAWDGPRQDNFDIYVKLAGPAGVPLRLTNDPATDTSPAYSPDGRWIAFVRLLPTGRWALIQVPALGGPERRLGEIQATPWVGEWGAKVAWSLDSSWLIVTDRPAPAEPSGLFAWSVATGERRRLTSSPPTAGIDTGPALSPDGRRLAFTRFVSYGIGDLFVLPLTGDLRPAGEPRRLTYENRFSAFPAWTPDGREIIFSSGSLTADATSLFAADASSFERGTSNPRRLTSIGEQAGGPSISRPSGSGRSHMVYTKSHSNADIWRIQVPDPDGKANTAEPSRAPFIYSTQSEYGPQYSPDGRRVAFVSHISGVAEIWVCDKDGANPVQVTTAGWPATMSPRWSPDSSQIVFQAAREGAGDIFTIPAGGGAPKRLTDDLGNEWGPSWSHDGRWIYFVSNRSGREQVWKAPAGGGKVVQVTKNGGTGPLESPDGRYVYYFKVGLGLWRIPAEGGDERQVLESLGNWNYFALTGQGIYFIPSSESPLSGMDMRSSRESTIEFFSFSNEKIHTVARLEKGPSGFTVSPDGRELLYAQSDQSGTDLMLVENFR